MKFSEEQVKLLNDTASMTRIKFDKAVSEYLEVALDEEAGFGSESYNVITKLLFSTIFDSAAVAALRMAEGSHEAFLLAHLQDLLNKSFCALLRRKIEYMRAEQEKKMAEAAQPKEPAPEAAQPQPKPQSHAVSMEDLAEMRRKFESGEMN